MSDAPTPASSAEETTTWTRATRRDHLLRALYALGGVALIGLGAAVLKVGGIGVDPYTAMNSGIADRIGWSLGTYQLLSNLVLFIPVLIWGRKYIGVGTVINMVMCGFFIDMFSAVLEPIIPDAPSAAMLMLLFAIGIIIFDFGASAYMTAGVGTAPYDALAPLIVDRTGWKYQRVRVPQDLIVLIGAVVAQGPVGLATVMTAFFNGPLIQFFTQNVNEKLVERLTAGRPAVRRHHQAGLPADPTDLL